jgi:hypothetical protein
VLGFSQELASQTSWKVTAKESGEQPKAQGLVRSRCKLWSNGKVFAAPTADSGLVSGRRPAGRCRVPGYPNGVGLGLENFTWRLQLRAGSDGLLDPDSGI